MEISWKHALLGVVVILLLFAAVDWLNHSPGAPSPSGNLISNSDASNPLFNSAYPAEPNWQSYEGVINGPNGSNDLSYSDLKGKVVLLDFWTYSCINCLRTLPYLTAWDARYKDAGLVIVGVHTPEFDFEKDRANIEMAVSKYGIHYPVVIDSDRQIWNLFNNNYWPRHYLIDRQGRVREDHIGEGGYSETEASIRKLLAEGQPSASNLSALPMANPSGGEAVIFNQVGSRELYFGGSFRRDPIGNDGGNPTSLGESRNFVLPDSLAPNIAYLNGTWLDAGDHMQLQSSSGDIVLRYSARSVYLVASASPNSASGGSPSPASAYLTATLDGQPHFGPDADANGVIAVSASRLYRVAQTPDYGSHLLVLHATGNLSAFSFTFG